MILQLKINYTFINFSYISIELFIKKYAKKDEMVFFIK